PGRGDLGGNAAHIIKQSKGAQNRPVPRPVHRVFAEEASAAGQFATRELVPERKAPPKRGISGGNGKRIQTAQSFERQGRRPSAVGHDGRWRWIFANRSLADRILANRSRRRRRRLLTRQVGGGGSAQHGQGCSQRS